MALWARTIARRAWTVSAAIFDTLQPKRSKTHTAKESPSTDGSLSVRAGSILQQGGWISAWPRQGWKRDDARMPAEPRGFASIALTRNSTSPPYPFDVSSNTVLSGGEPQRMGGPMVPMPRFT